MSWDSDSAFRRTSALLALGTESDDTREQIVSPRVADDRSLIVNAQAEGKVSYSGKLDLRRCAQRLI